MEGEIFKTENPPETLSKAEKALATPAIPETEKLEKSPYVLECEKLIQIYKNELIKQIENYAIDAELKIRLVDIVDRHLNSINFSDYSNASMIGIFVLGNKIMDELRDFQHEVIGTDNSYRYTGTEREIVEKVINPLMLGLGAKINESEIKRNTTNH